MPSLGDSLAALVAHACAPEVNVADQFAAFPMFYFPVEGDALATDGNPAAFQLLHLVNMIPDETPRFRMGSEFVWQSYRDLLEERILPADADPQLGYASRFAGAEAALGDGLASVQGHIWHPVEYLPGDLETGWTTEEILADAVAQLAPTVSEADRGWLAEIRTLPELGSEFVASVRYDRLTVLVIRPWFDRAVFNWRFWDYSGPAFSDGAPYPRGRLPAVVTKLILIRNLTMKLAEKALPDVGPGVMYRTIDGAAPARPDIMRDLAAVGGDPLKTAAIKLAPLDPATGPLADQLERLREEAAAEIAEEAPGAPSGYRRFHIKFGFDVAGPRAVAAAASAPAAAGEAAAQAAVDEKRRAIAAIEAKIATMGSGSGPSWIKNPFKKMMQLKLQQETLALAPLEQALTAAAAENRRWQNAMKLIDQLASIPSDGNPYVLAMVCDRLPKAPDPDPAVFA